MPLFGKIVVIRRDGVDGAHFPLTTGTCIFGRYDFYMCYGWFM